MNFVPSSATPTTFNWLRVFYARRIAGDSVWASAASASKARHLRPLASLSRAIADDLRSLPRGNPYELSSIIAFQQRLLHNFMPCYINVLFVHVRPKDPAQRRRCFVFKNVSSFRPLAALLPRDVKIPLHQCQLRIGNFVHDHVMKAGYRDTLHDLPATTVPRFRIDLDV